MTVLAFQSKPILLCETDDLMTRGSFLHFKMTWRQIRFMEGNGQLTQPRCNRRLFREVKHVYCQFTKCF